MRPMRQQIQDSSHRPIARHYYARPYRHHHARADSSGGSNTTTIVAVVCGLIGGVIVIFFLFQLSKKIFRKRAAPLPPVQPLAHQRGRTVSEFHDTIDARKTRGNTWYDDAYLHPMRTPSGSSASLIAAKERDSSLPSNIDTASSLFLRDGTGRETPTFEGGDSPHADEDHLPVPHRPFVDHRASSASSSNLSSDGRSGSLEELRRDSMDPVSPSTPPSASNSGLVAESSTQPLVRPRGRPRDDFPRPQSMASSLASTSNIHGRQGAPHSAHSRMQIVLPAPLAPELYPFGSETASDDGSANRRFTMVGDDDDPMRHVRHRTISDAWASPSSRSTSRPNVPDGAPEEHRRSRSSVSRPPPRRQSSSDSSRHQPRRESTSRMRPPVPALPSGSGSQASHSPLAQSPLAVSDVDPMNAPATGEDDNVRGRGQPIVRLHKQASGTQSKSKERARSQSRGRVLRKASTAVTTESES